MQPVADQLSVPASSTAQARMPMCLSSLRRVVAVIVSAWAPESGSSSIVPPTASSRMRLDRWKSVTKLRITLDKVDRERAAALPELQRAEAGLQQTLEEGLEDVVDILPARTGPDAVVNQPAVAVVERVDRTR